MRSLVIMLVLVLQCYGALAFLPALSPGGKQQQ